METTFMQNFEGQTKSTMVFLNVANKTPLVPPPPKKKKICIGIILFSISLESTSCPKRNRVQSLCKILRGKDDLLWDLRK